MSVQYIHLVLEKSKTRGPARLAMLTLASRADDAGYCWPGVAWISARMNTKERATQNALTAAEASGELVIAMGHGRGNTSAYFITLGLPDAVSARVRDAAMRGVNGDSILLFVKHFMEKGVVSDTFFSVKGAGLGRKGAENGNLPVDNPVDNFETADEKGADSDVKGAGLGRKGAGLGRKGAETCTQDINNTTTETSEDTSINTTALSAFADTPTFTNFECASTSDENSDDEDEDNDLDDAGASEEADETTGELPTRPWAEMPDGDRHKAMGGALALVCKLDFGMSSHQGQINRASEEIRKANRDYSADFIVSAFGEGGWWYAVEKLWIVKKDPRAIIPTPEIKDVKAKIMKAWQWYKAQARIALGGSGHAKKYTSGKFADIIQS